jgi:hypothetical protein
MKAYETSATVGENGDIKLAALPFAPGTRVEVSLTAIAPASLTGNGAVNNRVLRLFSALDKARNLHPVTPPGRAELYDRSVLR